MERSAERNTNQSDQDLVNLAFSGDNRAFGRLVSLYQAQVFNMCRRYVPLEDAGDLAQETFIRAFVHRTRFRSGNSVLPWLFTIARHLCIDALRRRSRTDQLRRDSGVSNDCFRVEASAEREMISRQQLAAVSRGIARLPEGQRETVMLHHVEQLSYREIAEVLDVPMGTVMTWLHRGRQALKDYVVLESKSFTKKEVVQ